MSVKTFLLLRNNYISFGFLDSASCPPPPNPDNGYFTPFGVAVFRPNDRIWFECNEGYTLIGEQDFTCERSGIWSPQGFPKCVGKFRPKTIFKVGRLVQKVENQSF